jgi:preprotein translocase, YajC subunit
MDSIGAFLPLILIFGVFYFLLIRPQQKKVKLLREMLNNLRRGDKIITSGGIIGPVNQVADNRELPVHVSENVEIRIAPGMVADLYTSTEPEKKPPVPENKGEKKGGLLSGLLGNKK